MTRRVRVGLRAWGLLALGCGAAVACGGDEVGAGIIAADVAGADVTTASDGTGSDAPGTSASDAATATDAATAEDTATATDAATAEDTATATDAATADDTATDAATAEDTATATDVATAEDAAPADTTAATDATSPDAVAVDAADAVASVPDPGLVGPLERTKSTLTLAGYTCDVYAPKAPGSYPLVFLSPGFLIDRASFAGFGEHLASHGFVALVPTWGDSAFAAIPHSKMADDVSKMIDAVLQTSQPIDPTRIAAAGHSRGGKAAILATIRDARIDACFGVDPVDALGPGVQESADNPSVTPELMGGLTVPFAVVGSELGGELSFGTACAPEDQNYDAYFSAAASAAKYEWVAPGSGHNDFAENLGLLALACPAGEDAAAARVFAKRKLVAFLETHLVGDARYAAWLTP